MEIENEMQYHKIGTNSELTYEDGSIWLTLIFYQNSRQLYTGIPFTTVRGTFPVVVNVYYQSGVILTG